VAARDDGAIVGMLRNSEQTRNKHQSTDEDARGGRRRRWLRRALGARVMYGMLR